MTREYVLACHFWRQSRGVQGGTVRDAQAW